jgi:hypothetical protein
MPSPFIEKEKLAIVKEGEKNRVKAVCTKYGISDQGYGLWRYKVRRIKPKKRRLLKEKLRIL